MSMHRDTVDLRFFIPIGEHLDALDVVDVAIRRNGLHAPELSIRGNRLDVDCVAGAADGRLSGVRESQSSRNC